MATQQEILPKNTAITETWPTGSKSDVASLETVRGREAPARRDGPLDLLDPIVTIDSSCTDPASGGCQDIQPSVRTAANQPLVPSTKSTTHVPTRTYSIAHRAPHQKHMRQNAIASVVPEPSQLQEHSGWAPPEFPPLHVPATEDINHAEVTVACRLPIPRPGFYVVYAPRPDRFLAPYIFPPSPSARDAHINEDEVAIAAAIPIPGGILKQLGGWDTGARVLMSFPSARKLFKKNDPPNETMFQEKGAQRRVQQAEDAAWKELRGRQLAEAVVSGEHVVHKAEVVDGSKQPDTSIPSSVGGKRRKRADPTLPELEGETKRWLEYFIRFYRGEASKGEQPNHKKSVLRKKEIMAIMRDAERYCNRKQVRGDEDGGKLAPPVMLSSHKNEM